MANELSDQMYRQLFDAAPDGIVLVDSSGLIVVGRHDAMYKNIAANGVIECH